MKKVFLLLMLMMLTFLLGACANTNNVRQGLNENKSEASKSENGTEETELDRAIAKLEEEKSEANLLEFFKKISYIPSEKNQGMITVLENEKGHAEIVDKDAYEKAIVNYSQGLRLINGDIYSIASKSGEDGLQNLILSRVGKDLSLDDIVLAEDVLAIQSFYAYSNKGLYFSALKRNGKSILAYLDFSNNEVELIKEYDLEIGEKSKVSGDFVSFIAYVDDKLIYQVSNYEEQNIMSDYPRTNSLHVLNDKHKEIASYDSSIIDSLIKIGDYYLTHDRSMGIERTKLKLFDKDFNIQYGTNKLDTSVLIGACEIKLGNKSYILIRELGSTVLIYDYENDKSYRLANILENLNINLTIVGNDIVLRSKNESYILRKE